MTTLNQVTPIPISSLTSATTLTGDEATAIVQGGATVQAPISQYPQGMAAGVVVYGNTGGAPFPHFRTLTAGTGINLSDGGSQGSLTISTDPAGSTSPATVYSARLNSVPSCPSLVNASLNSGHDGSTAFQTLVNSVYAAGGGTIYVDIPIMIGNITLPSGITIEGQGGSYGTGQTTSPGTGIIQSSGTLWVFTNAHQRSNYNGGSPVSNWSLIVDQDITIKNLYINGNKGSGASYNANAGNGSSVIVNPAVVSGDAYHSPSRLAIAPLQFMGVQNLKIRNVWVYDSCYLPLRMAYINGALIEDLTAVSVTAYAAWLAGNYQAAPDAASGHSEVLGLCRDIKIIRPFGYALDDFVEMDTTPVATNSGFTWGAALSAYFPLFYPGNIQDVTVVDANAPIAKDIISLNVNMGFSTNSRIESVTLQGAIGNTMGAPVCMQNYGAGLGTIGMLQVSDMQAQGSLGNNNANGTAYVYCEHNIEKFQFDSGMLQLDTVLGIPGTTSSCFYFSQGTQRDVIINDFTLYDNESNGAFSVYSNSTINRLQLSNLQHKSTSATADKVLYCAASAVIGQLIMSSVQADGMTQMVFVHSGATITDMVTSGISHINAGGGASIHVEGTVSRLRCGASDTVKLYEASGSGTTLSIKTDNTQDS